MIAAAVIGGYMVMNIGADDVANNVAAAVGSGALPLGGAIVLAMIFETAGALIAGGDVVSTLSKGIIDPSLMPESRTFILAMGSALLAAALWLNTATWIGAPVSTTHSIVGGAVGVGVAATIVDAASTGEINARVGIPLRVMFIGAIGIAIGLALFGARLISTVGKQLTTLDQTRASCVALSTATR